MNEIRKAMYQKGLYTWEKSLENIFKALDNTCQVCIINNCHQYHKRSDGGFNEPNEQARDCPLIDEPELCHKLLLAKEALSNLYHNIRLIIIQIQGLHAKARIEIEETS